MYCATNISGTLQGALERQVAVPSRLQSKIQLTEKEKREDEDRCVTEEELSPVAPTFSRDKPEGLRCHTKDFMEKVGLGEDLKAERGR